MMRCVSDILMLFERDVSAKPFFKEVTKNKPERKYVNTDLLRNVSGLLRGM